MKKLLIALIFMSFSKISFAQDFEGVWRGVDYDIELDHTFDEIEGSWGSIDYDINVDQSFQEIDGRLNGERIDVEFDLSFNEVEGILPCGKVDYEYDLNFLEVEGEMCGNEFEVGFDSKEEVMYFAQSIILEEIMSYFPRPVERPAADFITSRIKFFNLTGHE